MNGWRRANKDYLGVKYVVKTRVQHVTTNSITVVILSKYSPRVTFIKSILFTIYKLLLVKT